MGARGGGWPPRPRKAPGGCIDRRQQPARLLLSATKARILLDNRPCFQQQASNTTGTGPAKCLISRNPTAHHLVDLARPSCTPIRPAADRPQAKNPETFPASPLILTPASAIEPMADQHRTVSTGQNITLAERHPHRIKGGSLRNQ